MALAVLVLALFLLGAAAMIARVLPALIALPVMGIAIERDTTVPRIRIRNITSVPTSVHNA